MKKVTIIDIAKLAGVSKATVSMVLNKKDKNISEETKNKILNIKKELNYIPNSIARSLNTKKSGTIGIIIPDITNPYFSEIARAIEDAANSFGYNVMLCNSDNDIKKEEKYVELMISKLVDGVIFAVGGGTGNSIGVLKDNNIPFVLIDRYVEEYEDLYGILCLNEEGVKEGVEYLYSIGRRKIVFVTGSSGLVISRQRLDGYKSVMKKYNIYDNKYVYESNFSLEGGKKVTEKILNELKDIDAIFYSNDFMAIGGMKAIMGRGYKIPQDISIMGFDNIDISEYIEPSLTTISQPIYEMGRESCRLLMDLINDECIKDKFVYFKPKLIIRETT